MNVRDQIEARIGGWKNLADYLDAGPELPPVGLSVTGIATAVVYDLDEFEKVAATITRGAPEVTRETDDHYLRVRRPFGGGVELRVIMPTDYMPKSAV